MFKHLKKTTVFSLVFFIFFSGFSSACYAYKQPDKTDKKTTWQNMKHRVMQAKSFIAEKIDALGEKIAPYLTNQVINTAIFLAFMAISITIQILIHKKKLLSYKNPHPYVKKQVITLAKRLKIKNPHKLKIKVTNYKNYNGASDILGNIIISKKVARKIRTNKSKFIVGHELTHYKHGDARISFCLFILLSIGYFKITRIR